MHVLIRAVAMKDPITAAALAIRPRQAVVAVIGEHNLVEITLWVTLHRQTA